MFSRSWWRAVLWIFSSVSLLVSDSARARETPLRALELHWEAPSGCPDSGAVQSEIESWLARANPPVSGDGVVVRARVRAEGSGYELALEVRAAHGSATQEVYAERCDTLRSLVAMHAMLVAAPVLASAQVAPALAQRTDPLPPRVAYEAWPRAGAIGALWPRTGAEVGFTLGMERKLLRLELGFTQVLPREVGDAVARVRLRLAYGGARACLAPPGELIALAACGGADLGVMHGQGVDVSEARESAQGYLALALGGALRIPARTRIGVRLALEGLASLLRQRYRIVNGPDLFRSERWAVHGSLGIELRYP